MTIILTGIICDNTCLTVGYVGDNTPDYLGLFGPIFNDLMGQPFTLVETGTGYSLTITGHTLNFGLNDPHYQISFNDPTLVSFTPGAVMFTATGSNIFGFAAPETEYLCPIPSAVPEAPIWAMLVAGAMVLGCLRSISRTRHRSIGSAG
jgi:hypothetical protein